MNLQLLHQKLPEICLWIDRTLATHQSQARTTDSYAFQRLPKFYPPHLLATTKVIKVARLPVPPLSDLGLTEFAEFERNQYGGITFRDTYFVLPGEASSEALHFHELVHVVQWQHLGVEKFLMAYALGYLHADSNPSKYRNNPLEVMAYELQEHFEHGGPSINVQADVQIRLDALLPSLFANAR
jgi:hypothetical protein